MRRAALAIVAIALIAIGGTAIAAPGGGAFGGDRDDRQKELAKGLAEKLPGVEESDVSKALTELREEKRAEHRKVKARALADQLDGVSQADAEHALERLEAEREQMRRSGDRPDRGAMLSTLAKELGVSEDALREAMKKGRQAQLEERLKEAVEAGEITQEQADQIKMRHESGDFRGGFRHHGRGGSHGRGGPGGFRGPGGPGLGPPPDAPGGGNENGSAGPAGQPLLAS